LDLRSTPKRYQALYRNDSTIGGIILSRSIIIIIVIVGIIAAAALAYAFLRPTEEASGTIEAIPISQSESDPADKESDGDVAAVDSGEEDMDEANAEGSSEEGEAASDEAAGEADTGGDEGADTSAGEAAVTEPAGSEPILFQIVQSESEARFTIDEVLRGNPKTVIGVTDQVAGEILFDPADPSSAQVGTILINARTLVTDDDRRNRAIGNQVLDTGIYEFISFTPTEVSGLPEAVSSGETVNFQITGDLTIRDVTNEVTFEATVTFVSEDRLEGSASTIVLKEEYGLTIPNVPFVADVSEEVGLVIEFVAAPAS
jgi:polyisoprenoid-binding protein YceI